MATREIVVLEKTCDGCGAVVRVDQGGKEQLPVGWSNKTVPLSHDLIRNLDLCPVCSKDAAGSVKQFLAKATSSTDGFPPGTLGADTTASPTPSASAAEAAGAVGPGAVAAV